MKYPVPQSTPLAEQPVEFVEEVAGIYFRSVLLVKSGTVIDQHVHDHDHATFIGSGAARLWVNDQWLGDFTAGHAVLVRAGEKHLFMALSDQTRLACIHDAKSAESVKAKGA